MTNPANAPKWQSGTQSAEWTSNGPVGVGSSWLARRFPKQFDPQSKYKTLKANNPTAVYSAEILIKWLAQQSHLTTMIEQAVQADLQTMCQIIKWLPIRYNLGDYLNFYVSHDELHIDQAKRVLAAYVPH
ncbi:hypothetical protein MNBD_CHLOROFLEXI01-5149 [hydrothermal vent metagenome]|uniref:DinB-like domain-containing protein n=1 Tax=hydrothermal vent metagenome TaxID=652676 RepID=A0A3B0UTQ1_9ZZZZ